MRRTCSVLTGELRKYTLMNARMHISALKSVWHPGPPAMIALLCLRPQALDPPRGVMMRLRCRINFLDRVSSSDSGYFSSASKTENIRHYLYLIFSTLTSMMWVEGTEDRLLDAEQSSMCVRRSFSSVGSTNCAMVFAYADSILFYNLLVEMGYGYVWGWPRQNVLVQ